MIDAAVARVLRAKFELGLFEQPYVDVDAAARPNGHADHRALAREAARASIVLLKNERGVLPLARRLRSIAVIGTDAVEARLGGYSGPGIRQVSILDGIRRALGAGVTVRYAAGPGRVDPRIRRRAGRRSFRPRPTAQPCAGLRGEYFDNNASTARRD